MSLALKRLQAVQRLRQADQAVTGVSVHREMREHGDRQIEDLVRAGHSNNVIRQRLGVHNDRVKDARDRIALERGERVAIPAWVWPENREQYQAVAGSYENEEDGELAAAAWARAEQRRCPRLGPCEAEAR